MPILQCCRMVNVGGRFYSQSGPCCDQPGRRCHRASLGDRTLISPTNARTLCRTATASTRDGSSTSPGYRNIHAYFVNSTTSSMSGSSVWSSPTAWLPNFPKSCVLGTAGHATRGTPSVPFLLLAGNDITHPLVPADRRPDLSARTANPCSPFRTKIACRHGAERQAA